MRYLILLVLTLTILSCEKQYKSGDFQGILMTNITGAVTGELGTDDGDWQTGDSFSDKESGLFDSSFLTEHDAVTEISINTDTMNTLVVSGMMAYPNPSSDQMSFYFANGEGKEVTFKITLVDKKYDSHFSLQQAIPANSSLNFTTDLEELGIEVDELNRVYYQSTDETGVALIQGHGDIVYSLDPAEFTGLDSY